MSINASVSYKDDPLYQSLLNNFQYGKWETGIAELDQLIEKYPSDLDLLSLRKEIQLRASIDEAEQVDSKIRLRKRILSIGLRVLIAVVVFIAFISIINTYNKWFQNQITLINKSLETNQQEQEHKTKFNHAQQLMASYRPEKALLVLDEISIVSPKFPGLDTARAQAQSLMELEIQYSEAMQHKADGDLVNAHVILQAIEAENSGFRDVTLQVREIQREFSMTDLLDMADAAVRDGDWPEAVSRYEEVRNQDPLYEPDIVEDRLYFSYLNAAQNILDEDPDSIEALEFAQDNYLKALSIRPQDTAIMEELAEARESVGNRLFNKYIDMAQQALVGRNDSLEALKIADQYFAIAQSIRPDNQTIAQERRLAHSFLRAQNEFNIKNWEGVISNLKPIYEVEPDYAAGTARQSLYDAYIQLGDFHLRSGKPRIALEDYQKAVAIAELRPDSRIRLFESMVKIGDVLGVIGNYQAAVFQYRAAMDVANINEIVVLDLELINPINQAHEYAVQGKYKQAYSLYNEAMDKIVESLATKTHVVESGDYLTRLANYYNTTTTAILNANNISDPNDLSIGKRIIIPVIP